jgi:uncharacterized protein YciI
MAARRTPNDKVESMKTIGSAALAGALLITALVMAQEPRYEMTTYYVGILKKGPKWTPEATEETKKIQAGHMANIRKMAATGKLVVAGPFADAGDPRGLYIFKADSIEEVKTMVAEDPAVQAGRLVVDVRPWMAAKGIKIDPPVSAPAK